MRTVRLTKESTKDILENLLKRSPNNYGKFEAAVADILANVKEKGDEALFSYTKEFDKVEVTPETIRVTEAEIEEAYKAVDASESNTIKSCRCLCSRRKSSLSFFCINEYCAGKSGRSTSHRYDHTSWERR